MTRKDVITAVSNFQRNSGLDIHVIPLPIDNQFVIKLANHLNITGTRIRVIDVETNKHLIYGYIRRYKDRIDIGVKKSLNPCWTRFVTCKELSHILMGHNGDGTTLDPKNLINGLYSDLVFGEAEGDDLNHERLAILCAAEIMMPYEVSQGLLEDEYTTAPDIAEKFKIPLFVVQAYRDAGFLDRRREIYESL